jgi:hypothetical protein
LWHYPVAAFAREPNGGQIVPSSALTLLHRDLMSRLGQLHAEKVVLLPLLGALIAGIICLVGALNRFPAPPAAQDHAASPVSEDHQPLRNPG